MLRGRLDASGRRFAIIASRFNQLVTDRLVAGALDGLASCGASADLIELVWVPGAFEIPLLAARLARPGRVDALIALGAVIRGQTPHFEYVAGPCASQLAGVQTSSGVPVAFGVLTTETMEQAMDRAGGKAGNKGTEAAHTAVELADLLGRLPS